MSLAEAIDEGREQLPDLLAPGLKIVFVGSQAGGCSAKAGAYFAGRGNQFWPTLFEVGLTPRRFQPADYREGLELGFGFTDLVKVAGEKERNVKPTAEDLAAFDEKMALFAPKAIAFTSKGAGAFWLKRPAGKIGYGLQPALEETGPAVFVLPSPSGAARRAWDIEPWRQLAEWAKA
ncbi:mismatch-specific DNA-glycosylase [Methyloligella sp. 2.7D]|uniref:mismatch-specific DNA-glycosylase n=1 Tax=unclassified Methyloligella TaxID=2625955 RepID=UPI00157DACAF|nr:mismatch-specific DNA-glycosylase [Methyloligella sp. GL2]QKP76868.1 mismatch-specific DNA-glycosylase [Methyloligella sp. GL2]